MVGTASKYWASAYIDLIYVGAGKVGRDADNNIDFSTDNTTSFVVNGNSELKLDQSQLYPSTSDGLALGHASYRWSDLFLASGAVINIGGNVLVTHSSNALTLADDDKFQLGTGQDLQIYHDATNSRIFNQAGNLIITQAVDDADIQFFCDDGSGGVEEYLRLDGSSQEIIVSKKMQFGDNVKAVFGAGEDLDIFHDGTNSTINNAVNYL